MDFANIPIFGNAIDKTRIPPIDQRRILAFINHFILNTCSFLNEFTTDCETRFINLERKLQKLEASLNIIESKLSSIPELSPIQLKENDDKCKNTGKHETMEKSVINQIEVVDSTMHPTEGVKACDDQRYRKFFKMMQFGVPISAIKMKLKIDGLDPDILDTPDLILVDTIPPPRETEY